MTDAMKRMIYRILVSAALIAATAAVSSAQDVSSQQNRKKQLEREIEIIDRQLAENASQSKNALSELTLLRKKTANRRELIAQSDREIRTYSDRIYQAQREINRCQARVDTLSAHYARLIAGAYKNRDAKIWYMYILASEDLGQAFRRYGYFKTLSLQMKQQAGKIREAKEELETEKGKFEALKQDAEKIREERRKELAALDKEEKQAGDVVKKLNSNKTRYEKELASKRRQIDALDREIKRLVEAAMKSSSGSSGKEAAPIDYKLASEFSSNKGKLPWPAEGPVVDRFGQHYHPVYTRLKLPFNNGINIALPKSAEVRAVFDGVVKQIVVMPGYNQCVLIQHGNYFSFYCKLKSTSVKAGDKVKTGQTVGVVDTINGETQLHFQIWKGSSPQNPEHWLR